MNKALRIIMVGVAVFGIALLAKNKVAWAGGSTHEGAKASSTQVEGLVWDDVNQNGRQDVGEPGIQDMIVNLYNSANKLVNSTISDESGLYLFTDLTPGDYYVEIMPPTGFVISPQHRGGDEARDSDVYANTGRTAVKNLTEGEDHRIWDVGLHPVHDNGDHEDPHGSVKPPPHVVKTCKTGDHSVGGVAGLKIRDLNRGYCIQAFLWNHKHDFGVLPKDAGKFLSNITFLQISNHNRLIPNLPTADGTITICYAVPPGKHAQIYFSDFNHRSFDKKNEQPVWVPLQTTVENGVACAAAQSTGAYVLIGK